MHKRVHYVTRHAVSKCMYKEICRHILSREPLPTRENNPDAFSVKSKATLQNLLQNLRQNLWFSAFAGLELDMVRDGPSHRIHCCG